MPIFVAIYLAVGLALAVSDEWVVYKHSKKAVGVNYAFDVSGFLLVLLGWPLVLFIMALTA